MLTITIIKKSTSFLATSDSKKKNSLKITTDDEKIPELTIGIEDDKGLLVETVLRNPKRPGSWISRRGRMFFHQPDAQLQFHQDTQAIIRNMGDKRLKIRIDEKTVAKAIYARAADFSLFMASPGRDCSYSKLSSKFNWLKEHCSHTGTPLGVFSGYGSAEIAIELIRVIKLYSKHPRPVSRISCLPLFNTKSASSLRFYDDRQLQLQQRTPFPLKQNK